MTKTQYPMVPNFGRHSLCHQSPSCNLIVMMELWWCQLLFCGSIYKPKYFKPPQSVSVLFSFVHNFQDLGVFPKGSTSAINKLHWEHCLSFKLNTVRMSSFAEELFKYWIDCVLYSEVRSEKSKLKNHKFHDIETCLRVLEARLLFFLEFQNSEILNN